MLRVIAVFGASTYYLASEPLDYDNKYWEPRIANTFQLNRQFEISEKTGNRIRSMELTLDNRGQYFNAIEATSGFLNMKVTFLFKEGTKNYQKFTGRVNKVNSFGDEISLSIMESGYEYLKSRIPDAQIAYDYYSQNGLNESWNAIPIPFGTVDRIPLSWVNLFRSEFIIGSGPLYLIRKLYFDKTLVYDASTGKNGYKPTPESEEIKFRVFHGTGSVGSPEVVDGVTSEYPGFAYVQLYKLVGGVETPADPVTPDGEVTKIYADIYGIRNALNTDAERNPAQILYNLMTKPTTGYEGYGLGLSTSDLDFADAILECTVQGFKIDGVIDNTAEFGEWMNEILRCCRGNVIEEDGKIKLTVDAAKTASGLHFDETGADGFHCDIDPWEEPDIDSQTNRVRLSYSWNFERGDFNKKPSVHEESPILDPNLKDTAHATRIGKWNTETLEFKLIRDDTTAHKLAQYYLKNITKQLKRTSLVTEVNIGDLDAGEVITVTSPKYGWVEKEFLVTGIKRSQEQTNIEIKEYSDDVYVFTDPGTGAEDSGSQYSAYNVPAKPTMTSLTVVNEKLTDGTIQTRIDVVFVKPATNVYLVALYYKPVGDPDTSFKPLDFTVDATRISAIWKGIETGNYNFRLVSVSPVGIYSDIAIEAGDKHYFGQPGAESYKTLTGDTVAPGTPAISDINPILGGVSFYMTISGGIPDDFSHFKVYRKIGTAAEELLDENWPSQLFSDIDRGSGYDARTYAAIAVDKSGNESALSSWSASTVPLRVNTADIEAASVTTDKLTAQQIIAKDFRTACNAGNGVVSGVILNANGFQAWNGACRTVNISNTGDVEIAGTITATSGVIGGWCAASCCLYSGNLILHGGSGYIAGCYAAGTKGFCLGAAGSAEFNCITVRGTLYSCAGVIGGWTLATDRISCLNADCSFISLGAWPDGTGYRNSIYVGANCVASACGLVSIGNCLRLSTGWTSSLSGISIVSKGACQVFRATSDRATGDNFCGLLAGWNFNASQLYSTGCGLILCNTGAIQTGDFVTSNKGWKIDSIGNAEFNNICARGAIRTAVFIKDEISVVGGCAMIRPANIWDDSNALSATSASYWLKCTDEFAVNDLIRIKDGVNDYWGHVTAKGVTGGKPFITATFKSGVCNWTPTKGQAVVNYGSCLGCGGIMLNGQCPYIDLYTHAGSPWSALCSRVRIGNLKNWSANFVCDTYGIAMGSALGQYMTYDSVSGVLDIAGNINVKSTLPLVMPAGAVGEWVAKGSTTASIAVAGGVIDISGNANHGSTYNSVTVVDTEVGKAFDFDGVSDYIYTPVNLFSGTSSANPASLSLFIKHDSTQAATAGDSIIFGQAYYSGFGLSVYNGRLRAFFRNSASQWNSNNIGVQNAWQHIALVWGGQSDPKVYVYLNGILIKTVNITYANFAYSMDSYPLRIASAYAGSGSAWTTLKGQVAHPKAFNRALSAEEVKTLYLLGKDTESGTITAERIKTGVLRSLNWNGTTLGSCISMNDGTFKFGGESAPKLSWNGTTLCVNGEISSCSGDIGGWTIGATSIVSSKTNASMAIYADYSTSMPMIEAGICAAGVKRWINMGHIYWNGGYQPAYGFSIYGNGVSGSFAAAHTNVAMTMPDGTAIAADRTFMWIGTTTAYMKYYDGVLSVKGVICATSGTFTGVVCASAGNIGGWKITPECIAKSTYEIGTRILALNSSRSSIYSHVYGCGCGIWLGQIYAGISTGWTNRHGFAITKGDNEYLFRADYDANGNNQCVQIAGWNFNANCLYSGNLIMNSAGAISGCFNGTTTGWCINAAGDAVFNNATVRGTLCSCAGNIGGFGLGNGYIGSLESGYGDCYYTARFSGMDNPSILLSYGITYGVSCTCISLSGSNPGSLFTSAPIEVYVKAVGCTAIYTTGAINTTGNIESCLRIQGRCICGTTCIITPIGCGTTCLSAPILCGLLRIVASTCAAICVSSSAVCAIRGASDLCHGVHGYAGKCYGVTGWADCCYGVFGCSCCFGVYGCATGNYGVIGRAAAYGIFGCSLGTYGVYGYATTNYGVAGQAVNYGVFGSASTSYPVAGNGAYYNTSTRTLKQNFEDIYVLPGLRSMCIQKWTWADCNQRGFDEFVAPTAEDVSRAWGLTFTDDGYYTLDGIALKAAQEIDENVQVHDQCIEYLKNENIELKSCICSLSDKMRIIEERLGIN